MIKIKTLFLEDILNKNFRVREKMNLINNLAESHFGQSDTLARDTLAGTLWPE